MMTKMWCSPPGLSRGSWLLTVTWLLGNIVDYGTSECSKLSLGGTMWQSIREGTYKRTDATCSGRNVYKQDGGSNYLYYIDAIGGWKRWMVGSSQCVNSGGVACLDQALYPEDAVTTWEEVYGGSWYNSKGITVKCYKLSGAAITGICIGFLIAAGMIIAIIVYCCWCKIKNTNRVQQHTTPISYTNASAHYTRGRPGTQPQHPAYYTGPPAYGAPMVHGYGPPTGPPPTYTSYPPANATAPTTQNGAAGNAQAGTSQIPAGDAVTPSSGARPPSVPPMYAPRDPNGQGDPYGYPTKVND